MPPDTLDIHSSCLVSKALAHCLVPGALQHDLSSAQQGSMPLAHATPLWKRSAPGVSLAAVHWNLTASAGQLPCPWRGAPNKPHLLLAGVLPSRFWGVALHFPFETPPPLSASPPLSRFQETPPTSFRPHPGALTNKPWLIFSLYVLRCDPCRASAPLADPPAHLLQALARLLCSPRRDPWIPCEASNPYRAANHPWSRSGWPSATRRAVPF
jgi:hypothetical protein